MNIMKNRILSLKEGSGFLNDFIFGNRALALGFRELFLEASKKFREQNSSSRRNV